MTTLAIARFEVAQRLRRISTWIYVLLFAAMSVFFVLAAGGALSGAAVEFGTGGKVFINSPYSLHMLEILIGFFGTIIVAAIAGQATFQDVHHNATAMFFTAPISRRQYLLGRFAGAFLICLLIYAAIGLGAALAVRLPWLDASRVGTPPGALAYLQPYLTVLLPNLFLTVSIFFAVATLSRRMLPVYAGAVVLLIGYLIAINLSDQVEQKALVSLLDPFGLIASDRVTEYWTVSERNARRVPLQGMLLWNRLLWTAVGAALLALTFWRFSFTEAAAATGGRRKKKTLRDVAPAETPAATLTGLAPLDFSTGARLSALWKLTGLQFRETVKSVIFLVIVLAGLLFMVSTAQSVGRLFGTTTWPVTYEILELVGGSFMIFILAIITFYSGELVWRERDANLAQIQDALPTPRWLIFVSKWLAMVGVLVLLQGLILLCGVAIQAVKGYTHFELGLYLTQLYGMGLIDLVILSTLAFLVHVLVNQKYVGHVVMIGYYIVTIALPLLGFESRLVRFGSRPDWSYSDMNGFGHFVWPIVAFKLYWGALALVMAVASNVLWVRGVETGWRHRLKLARERLSPVALALGAIGLAGFLGMGGYLTYQIHIRGRYQTRADVESEAARYEKTYKHDVGALAPPRVVGAKVDADIFPAERRVALRGHLELKNKSAAPIDRVVVMLNDRAQVKALDFGRGETLETKDPIGMRIYRLARPLAPGEPATLSFELGYQGRSLENSASLLQIVENGTFMNSIDFLPTLGYREDDELSDDGKRRSHGLEPKARIRDLDDASGLANNYVSRDGDWISFESTISTSPDQIAIAPGYLQREWTQDGRRSFHYKMDAEILNFYAFISARYSVKRDRWNDVAIEIYHHPTHTYDVDAMIRSIKASLDYFTRAFGPYQHHQVRIIEFPRYERFAQSFPNTIPYSESIGFIARYDEADPAAIDYVFYVTAHEVAHQWWAHQVIGGNVQGATMLSESFSQYSAVMVMKHAYGELAMRKFLRYALDQYLRGRASERKKELPLYRVEDQNYIHYSKGTLVMYALQDAIGEDRLNRALARYLEQVKYKGPPYTRSTEFLAVLREEAGPSAEPLIHDLFEAITLYELRVTSATATARPDGAWDITVKGNARKVHAGELGEEKEVALDEDLPFGALDADGRVLVAQRRRVGTGDFEVTFTSEKLPAKAGVDPLSMMIDRKPDDNVIAVEVVQP